MKLTRRNHIAGAILALSLLTAAGCKKKVVPPAPQTPQANKPEPTAPPKRPQVQFTADPGTIARGESATLRWTVTDADTIRIEPGVGSVQASGSRQVFPTGPGGTTEANAFVNVSAPAAATPPSAPTGPSTTFRQAVEQQLQDVYFDYNSNEVREDARAMLQRNAEALKAIFNTFSTDILLIEGHCDERGSGEYNLGLGDRRATTVKEFLTSLGIPANRMRVVSYGKERPQCTEANEGCWQKNRRAHFGEGQ
jgi:peptidoglycan-associated lipoprotein